MKWIFCLTTLFLPVLFSSRLFGHTTALSSSELSANGTEIFWKFKVHLADFNLKFQNSDESVVERYLKSRLKISRNQKDCSATQITISQDRAAELALFEISYRCPESFGKILVSYDLFYGDLNHRHLLQVHGKNGTETTQFSSEQTTFETSVTDLKPQTFHFWDFLKMGLMHLACGFDHLLFVFTLTLTAASFRRLFVILTTFTVAHSASLALSWTGFLSVSPKIVEPLIALSIAWVALSGLVWANFKKSRFEFLKVSLVPLGFGLIHGLGFSGALQELNLSSEQVLLPLFAFNAGLEIAQVGFVLLLLPALYGLRFWLGHRYPKVVQTLLLGVLILSVYWIFERILGGAV